MNKAPAMDLVGLGLSHVEVMAAVHGACFDEGWSASSFETALGMPGTFGFIIVRNIDDEPLAFALFRAALIKSGGGEAEVLTIATRPAHRGQGLARQLMEAGLSSAHEMGVETMFLEVAHDNSAAIALYIGLGFEETGRRKNYYTRADKQRIDALVMSRVLSR